MNVRAQMVVRPERWMPLFYSFDLRDEVAAHLMQLHAHFQIGDAAAGVESKSRHFPLLRIELRESNGFSCEISIEISYYGR